MFGSVQQTRWSEYWGFEPIFTCKIAVDQYAVSHAGRLLLQPINGRPVQSLESTASLRQQHVREVTVENDFLAAERQHWYAGRDLVTEDDVEVELAEEDQVDSSVDHADVRAQSVAATGDAPRQPVSRCRHLKQQGKQCCSANSLVPLCVLEVWPVRLLVLCLILIPYTGGGGKGAEGDNIGLGDNIGVGEQHGSRGTTWGQGGQGGGEGTRGEGREQGGGDNMGASGPGCLYCTTTRCLPQRDFAQKIGQWASC